ncbi:MAG TPA: NFACT RNA binding domain-containing protein, partial [Candidatus Polarisedimenticolaceae bacterium]|nr:NFACT RNA binding domain-containing protein [Candidatus Polarisedimenticolaceae bacterium]
PDPYDPDRARVTITAAPGVPLTRVAEELYRKQRRARRGAEAAAHRAEALRARRETLGDLAARHEDARSASDAEAIEAALRASGIAVGLARSKQAARAQAATAKPAVAGVRVVTSRDGFTILIGQTGRDNDRLTFKIASPEDVWLHASGVPGAHVVIRAAERGEAPPPATLHEAASLAAWFSDARGSATVDVQWTRRKNVRRARGAAPGTVLVKRFEVVRVRPRPIDPRESVP